MTREEIIKVLEMVSSAYPHAKIKDASSLVSVWELALGEFSTEAVVKAVRLHFETNKFFPSPSDIRDNIVRGQIVYSGPTLTAIESHTSKNEEIYLDAFCRWIGFGSEPDDSVELPKGFLNYEL